MQAITTTIDISVPPAKVWSIITDIDGWSDWSPTIRASSGTPVIGGKLDITMCGKTADVNGPKYSPKMMSMVEPTTFSWTARMGLSFMFTNDKIITLEEIPAGTRVTHTETFRGLMAKMSKKRMEEGVPPMLKSMNEALKIKAEA
jgi:hypothetical protein